MSERRVTFTVLDDGLYLPSVGAVLPAGEYAGRIEERGNRVADVVIILRRELLDALGLDKGGGRTLQWSIVNDYRAGLIREDR